MPDGRAPPVADSKRSGPLGGRAERWRALGSGLAATVLFALSYPLAGWALAEVGPLTLAGLRSFGGFLVELAFLLLAALTSGRALPRLRPRHWPLLALIGALGYTATLGLAYWGLRYTSPTTISLLVNLAPVFVLALGWAGLKETPRPLQLVGMGLACAGLTAFFGDRPALGERPAMIAGLASALAYSLGSLLSRRLLQRGVGAGPAELDSLTLSAWSAGLGGALALGLAWPLEGAPRLDARPGGELLAVVGCLAVLSTGLAYPLWNYSLGLLRAFERDVLLAVVPAETALIARAFFSQDLATHQLIGLSLALVGVLLVQAAAVGAARRT